MSREALLLRLSQVERLSSIRSKAYPRELQELELIHVALKLAGLQPRLPLRRVGAVCICVCEDLNAVCADAVLSDSFAAQLHHVPESAAVHVRMLVRTGSRKYQDLVCILEQVIIII